MVKKPGFGSRRSSYMVRKIMSHAFAGKIVPGLFFTLVSSSPTPESALTIEQFVEELLKQQQADGGWGCEGDD